MGGRAIEVLIVDDHPLIREGLRELMEDQTDLRVVALAGSGQEAVDAVKDQRPDVVLMDVLMPGMDGIAATQEIARLHPGLPVIMLSSLDQDIYIYQAVMAGAAGYLPKSAPCEQVIGAVRAAAQGDTVLSPSMTLDLMERFQEISAALEAPSEEQLERFSAFTPREMDVLRQLCSGASNEEIAEQLFISERTAKKHVSSILEKLGVESRLKAVVIALRSELVEH